MNAETGKPATPYEALGGEDAIARIVNRFYDLMDGDLQYAELRAMHGSDLAPMRRSLAGWLAAWAGGPRDWFAARPGVCMMSLHRSMPIDAELARQWTDAMGRALDQVGVEPEMAEALREVFGRMSENMTTR